ncbi:MAG: hypothetical protein VX986_06320 [Pseudomonadota bacterium]|nr:hypothetical protein [Pseudomonadota bacterium]
MIVKGESTRLPYKNTLRFLGRPLFERNLLKLLEMEITVVVDSDSDEILSRSEEMGAVPRIRPSSLRGHEVPSVPIFASILEEFSQYEALLNVQANSPCVAREVIQSCLHGLMDTNIDEVLTCYSDYALNGSVWGFSRNRVFNYGDFYSHSPDLLVVDDSIDVHTKEEFELAEELARAKEKEQR